MKIFEILMNTNINREVFKSWYLFGILIRRVNITKEWNNNESKRNTGCKIISK